MEDILIFLLKILPQIIFIIIMIVVVIFYDLIMRG